MSNGEWDEELLQEWDAAELQDWGVDIHSQDFDLISMDDLNLDKNNRYKNSEFAVTFVFDNELKESFNQYFKKNGKESITNLIIDTICQDAEAK